MAAPCNCDCHTNPYTPCSIPGGCGTTGCQQGTCLACHIRTPQQGLACEPCRNWLPTALTSIPRLAADARAELIPADDSTTQHVLVCPTCKRTAPWTPNRGNAHHPNNTAFDDPNHPDWHGIWIDAHLITYKGGPTPSTAPDTIITGGTIEPSTPLNLHLHDLPADVIRDGGKPVDVIHDTLIPADTITPVTVPVARIEVTERHETTADGTTTIHHDIRHIRETLHLRQRQILTDEHGNPLLRPAGDQTGVVSVAQALDQDVRAMIDAGAPGSRWRPTPTIESLTEWIKNRLPWAYDNYHGLDALTATIKRVRGQLMAVLGEFDPEPELCDGVECSRCGLRMLYRRQDGSGDVECHNPDCRKVFRADDYHKWVEHLSGYERSRRSPDEVTRLLRGR